MRKLIAVIVFSMFAGSAVAAGGASPGAGGGGGGGAAANAGIFAVVAGGLTAAMAFSKGAVNH